MNRVQRLLAAKRAKQIAGMEGRTDEASEPVEPVPSILARLPRLPPPQRAENRLRFTHHARTRMAQRNMRPVDVYALYQAGEREAQHDGCARFYATRSALHEAAPQHRPSLERFLGSYIVVNEDERVLVTVVHDGQDSR